MAVAEGYEIVQIHEIWEYKIRQYDPITKTGGFFAAFINHFLKIKTQAVVVTVVPDRCTEESLYSGIL